MPGNTFPSSAVELSPLQDYGTPSLLDIRPYLGALRGRDAEAVGRSLEQIQQAFDVIQQVLRSAPPALLRLSVNSADIENLTVSGQYGPGIFQILNGLPNYDQIGWIGSLPSASTVSITSIVAGLVTTGAVHKLKVGDNVYIENTTDLTNTGFYVVATTPLTTTFTVTGGVNGGNSTGGTMTKQFQGLWIKSAAVGGTAFDNAKLIADVDGSLTITGAQILLNGSSASIEIDPVTGKIIVTQTGGGRRVTIGGLGIVLDDSTGSPADRVTLTPSSMQFNSNNTNQYQLNVSTGGGVSLFAPVGSFTLSKLLDIYGYSGSTSNGPLISFTQLRGTGASSTATQSGDTIGGFVAYGFDGTGESDPAAGVRSVATEAHGTTSHGSKIVFEVTPDGTSSVAAGMVLDQDGSLDVLTSLKINGTKVVGARGSALTAAASYSGGVAGGTYTSTEQGLINALISQVSNLKTRVDQLEARLGSASGHGLFT